MKAWPLSAKLTAWSALIVGLAVLACGIGAVAFIQHEQIEALDDQLHNEAHIFFTLIARQAADPSLISAATVRTSLPGTNARRFVRVQTSDHVIYESKLMRKAGLAHLAPGSHTLKTGSGDIRMGVFQQPGLTVYLGTALSEINADKSSLLIGLGIMLPFFVATVAGGGWLLARKALAPIREITAATEQITASRLDQRLPVPPAQDDIGRLAQVLNSMFDRLEKSFHHATRFSADASHELKTPLTILRNVVEELLVSPTMRGADQRKAQVLLEQTLRLSSITDSLLLLSRADTGQLRIDLSQTNICEIIEGVTEDAGAMAQDRQITIETKLPERLIGLADPGRLSQILLNLLENAVKYNRVGGRISVSAGLEEDGRVYVRVANTGSAIPAEKSAQIFHRFFRITGDVRVEGHGLGLSIAHELVRAHGGELTLERSDDQWTEFLVRLGPMSPEPMTRSQPGIASPKDALPIT